MFYRLSNSWRLFGCTLEVLSRDKELLIFPVLSGIASTAILATFAAGMWGTGLLEQFVASAQSDQQQMSRGLAVTGFLVSFAWYFVNFFAMTYFGAALVGAAYVRLRGGDPTVADGFAAANRCLPAILGYSLIAATVGMILRMLQNQSRENIFGRIVLGLIGMAWTLITYLVVPVLVIERLGPINAVKRSTSLLRETWGEQIIANFGFGLLGFLFSLVGFAIAGVGVWLMQSMNAGPAVLIVAVGLAVLYWAILGVLMSALQGIYTAALYGYASGSEVRGFPVELVQGAFSQRY